MLVGVVAGLITASGAILHGNLRNSYNFHTARNGNQDIFQIQLAEELSFLNKASIRETLNNIPEGSTVIIDGSATKYIDYDVLEIIKEFRDIQAPLRQITCTLIGFKDHYQIEEQSNMQSLH